MIYRKDMNRGVSIAKFNDHVANEDAFYSSDTCIAVSDGAGGCGLFANEWSEYLVKHLPKDKPIVCFKELDEWVDGIWEPFYNEHEERAKEGDGILLNKYYNEGSCATIAAAWITGDKQCKWMAYGDSVVFHYSKETGVLEHSFTKLSDFSNPPRLVSSKDPLEEEGFSSGDFYLDESSVVFVASDALSHYIMMMYELSKSKEYGAELAEEYLKASGNSQLLKTAEMLRLNFTNKVIVKLLQVSDSQLTFEEYLKKLYRQGVIDIDDFTICWMSHDVLN